MAYLLKLFSEAIFVGISLIILGNLVGFLVGKYYIKPELPSGCSEYNKYYVMELTLFLTGFFLHILCEVCGLNRWYISNSAAALLINKM